MRRCRAKMRTQSDFRRQCLVVSERFQEPRFFLLDSRHVNPISVQRCREHASSHCSLIIHRIWNVARMRLISDNIRLVNTGVGFQDLFVVLTEWNASSATVEHGFDTFQRSSSGGSCLESCRHSFRPSRGPVPRAEVDLSDPCRKSSTNPGS